MSVGLDAQVQAATHKALRARVRARRVVSRVAKGDFPGHPFRGNQYTDGAGGGGLSITSVDEQFNSIFGGGENASSAGGGSDRRGIAQPLRERPWKELSGSERSTRISDYVEFYDKRSRSQDPLVRVEARAKMARIEQLMATPDRLEASAQSWHENYRQGRMQQQKQAELEQKVKSGVGPDDIYDTPPDKVRQRVASVAENVARGARLAEATLRIASELSGRDSRVAPGLAVGVSAAATLATLALNLNLLSRSKHTTSGAQAARGVINSVNSLRQDLPKMKEAAANTKGAAGAQLRATVNRVESTLKTVSSSPVATALAQSTARGAFRATGGRIVAAPARNMEVRLAPTRPFGKALQKVRKAQARLKLATAKTRGE
jgi:hypothetical protein